MRQGFRVIAGAAVIAALTELSRSAAGATTCAPTATVDGPQAIVKSVSAILRAHGVGSGPSACGPDGVRAVISEKPSEGERPGRSAYVLRLEDLFGRTSERDITSAETAASLIESWVVGEDSDLVAPRATASITATAEAPPPPDTATSAAGAGPRLTASAEISSTGDGSTWYGGSASACVRVGAVCIGGRGRYARSTGPVDEVAGAQLPGVELTRTTAGGLVVVALLLQHRRIAVLPTLGLGAAWMRTEAALAPLSASVDDAVLLADGAIAAEVSIAGGWSVLAEVGATWEPSLSASDRQGTAAFLPAPPSRSLRAGIGIGFSP
jgi:hypothetical protein